MSFFSRVFRWIPVLVLAPAFVTSPGSAPAAGDFGRSEYPEQKMVDLDFEVQPGGMLRVDVEDMDVYVKEGRGGEAHVEVYVAGPDEKKAREYFEEKMMFDASQKGNTISIEAREPRVQSSFLWSRHHKIRVWAIVSVPKRFDADVSTEDGDVHVDALEGTISLRTEDGDILTGELAGGSVDVRSEDGDVKAKTCDAGRVTISTEDGGIAVDRVKGKRVVLATEDGDIWVERIEGGDVSVETSDGDITFAVSGESLEGECSDGDIRVELLSEMRVDLRTNDGDIHISIPKTVGAELDLSGDDVNLSGSIQIEGRISNRRVVGAIHNGGPTVKVRTSDGHITVKRRG